MTEIAALHLPAPYLKTVQAILKQHLPTAQVWAYGSRVRGDHYEASDLDLVVRQPQQLALPTQNLAELREAFTDSNVPLLVQVLDWSRTPAAFHNEILDAYVVLQSGDGV